MGLKGLAYAALRAGDSLRRRLPPANAERLRQNRNFLLLQYPMALGTAVHATPLVSALRMAVPDARIVVAASGLAAQVFRNHPAIDLLLETPSALKAPRGAVRALRGANLFSEPYITLLTTGNERTKTTLTAIAAGRSYRVGFSVAPALMDASLSFDPTQSQIRNNLRILEALGHAATHAEPLILPSNEVRRDVVERMQAERLLDGRPIAVLVTQTSATQQKGWRPERFHSVAQHLHAVYGAHLVFVGTKDEATAIEALRGSMNLPSVSFAGTTDIPQLAALFERCDIGVTLDTGPLHVGRAVGLPMVVIAPSWSPVIEWLPVGDPRYVILKNADMLPPPPKDYVIDEVSVQEVTDGVDDLLRRHPAGTRSALAV